MYFIGIDSSTTATKALLMDEAGNVLGVASSEYSFETPQPLWSEQSPSHINDIGQRLEGEERDGDGQHDL